jgi:hypothetical protein
MLSKSTRGDNVCRREGVCEGYLEKTKCVKGCVYMMNTCERERK